MTGEPPYGTPANAVAYDLDYPANRVYLFKCETDAQAMSRRNSVAWCNDDSYLYEVEPVPTAEPDPAHVDMFWCAERAMVVRCICGPVQSR